MDWGWVANDLDGGTVCWYSGRMAGKMRTIVRAFDGSLADAEGLLAVDRATFDECPYSARELQAMLSDGAQRAWLAVGGGSVAGSAAVIGFVATAAPVATASVDVDKNLRRLVVRFMMVLDRSVMVWTGSNVSDSRATNACPSA